MMYPKELMLSAIRKQPVDRVVAATYNFHPFRRDFQEPAYRPMLEAVSRAEHFGVLCKAPLRWRGGRKELMRSERLVEGGAVLTNSMLGTPKGQLEMLHKKPGDQPGYVVEPLIKTDRDIDRFLSLSADPSTPDLSPTKELHEKIGDKGITYVAYDDPFYSVARWFKFEDFAIRCIENLPLIEALVKREFQRIRIELGLMLEQSRGYHDFLFYTAGPEVATPPLLATDIFERLVTRYQKRLVKKIKDAGHLSSIHCHGKVGKVFEQFREIGAHVLEPMEPPPQGDLDLEEALDRAGDICLMGYIQDQDIHSSKPGQIREKVRAICRLVQQRGNTGYIMTPTATPYMHPPGESFVRNYVEFVQAAEEFGRASSN